MESARALSVTYDIFTAIISVLDVATDIIIMVEFYHRDRMIFFWLSFSILIVAQLAYCIAFWWRYADVYDFRNSIIIFMCTLPFAPILSFVFYFAADNDSRVSQCITSMCSRFDLCVNTPSNPKPERSAQTNRASNAFREWAHNKMYKHLGFILEAAIESFPQSILQLVAIVYYNEYHAVSVISIAISMISVSSKSLILSVTKSINWKTAIFHWISCITDFFAMFCVVSLIFYSPSATDHRPDDSSPFRTLQQIFMYNIVCTVAPFAVFGSIAINLNWSARLSEPRCHLCCCITFLVQLAWLVGLVITVLAMQIMGFVVFAVMATQGGFAGRINYNGHAQDFYMEVLSFIRRNAAISSIDGKEVINKQQDEIIRICCANKILLDSLSKSALEKRFLKFLKQHSNVNDHRKYPFADVSLQEIQKFSNAESKQSCCKIVQRSITELMEWLTNKTYQGGIELPGHCASVLVYALFPLYMIGRLFTMVFVPFIAVYLAAHDVHVFTTDIPIFQNVMFAAYSVLLVLFIISFLATIPEQKVTRYILLTRKKCDLFDDFERYFTQNKNSKLLPIEAYYDSIVTVPIIEQICTAKFGADITQIIKVYYQSLADHTFGTNRKTYPRHRQNEPSHKMLLLGSGGSGKTTVFKQLQRIFGEEDRDDMDDNVYRRQIKEQVLDDIDKIIFFLRDQQEEEHDEEEKKTPSQFDIASVSDASWSAVASIESYDSRNQSVVRAIKGDLKILWNDDAIKALFVDLASRARLRLTDTFGEFMDDIDRIAASEYVPTEEDMVRVYHRTTGIIENTFFAQGSKFRLVDVGGQRSERKKWIHSFENVRAVLFVASLSHYNESLFEDEDKNAMEDAIDLFREIVNLRWFTNSTMILLLNKQDLFAEKIKSIPITECPMFAEFDGDATDFEQTVNHIQTAFLNCNHDQSGNLVFPHTMCATDMDNVQRVYHDIVNVVIRRSMRVASLLL